MKITYNCRGGKWEYHEDIVYDVRNDDGSQLFRVGVYIEDEDGKIGQARIFGVILKVNAPLPNGISFTQYLDLFTTLEKQGYLEVLHSDDPDIEDDYLIIRSQSACTCLITSSPFDPEFVQEIENWLEEFLAEDDFLDEFGIMIKSARDESSSTEEDQIVSDSREKSTDGVEVDTK